jgi:DNA-nicking Smr family endonuclease
MARTPKPRREPRPVLTPEERAMFMDAVAGAVPLGDRVPLAPATPPRPPVEAPTTPRALREAEPPPVVKLAIESAGEVVTARGPGVSHAQVAELRAGRVRPEETLDLHGMTAVPAEVALRRFLVDAARLHRRCVLVVHGRGLHSGGVAVLRDMVVSSLVGPLSGLVHSFATAHARDGGPGATYVVVRA